MFLKVLIACLFCFSKGYAAEQVDFKTALDLESSRIAQVLALSKDVYTLSLELTENPPPEGALIQRQIIERNYRAAPFFGLTGQGTRSCIGAIYQLDDTLALFIAHRGTIFGIDEKYWWSDFITDFNCSKVPIKGFQGLVHGGFEHCHQSFFQEIQRFVEDKLRENPRTEIFTTGHSLGGALATLSALKLSPLVNNRSQIRAICFSSPRIGDETFVREAHDRMPGRNVLNFHCHIDPVTCFPAKVVYWCYGLREYGVPIETLLSERIADAGLVDGLWRNFLGPFQGIEFMRGGRRINLEIAKAFVRILLDSHAIGPSETIVRAFEHTKDNVRDPNIPLSEVGRVPIGSHVRNPFVKFFKRYV